MRPRNRVLSTALAIATVIPAHAVAQGVADQYRATEQAYREAAAKASGDRRACFLEWAEYYQCVQRSLGPGSAICAEPSTDPGCPAEDELGAPASGLTPLDGSRAGGGATSGGDPVSTAASLIASSDSSMEMAGMGLMVGSLGLWWLSNQESFLQGNDQWEPCVERWGEASCTSYLEPNRAMTYAAAGALVVGSVLFLKGMSANITVNVTPKGASVSKRIRF